MIVIIWFPFCFRLSVEHNPSPCGSHSESTCGSPSFLQDQSLHPALQSTPTTVSPVSSLVNCSISSFYFNNSSSSSCVISSPSVDTSLTSSISNCSLVPTSTQFVCTSNVNSLSPNQRISSSPLSHCALAALLPNSTNSCSSPSLHLSPGDCQPLCLNPSSNLLTVDHQSGCENSPGPLLGGESLCPSVSASTAVAWLMNDTSGM